MSRMLFLKEKGWNGPSRFRDGVASIGGAQFPSSIKCSLSLFEHLSSLFLSLWAFEQFILGKGSKRMVCKREREHWFVSEFKHLGSLWNQHLTARHRSRISVFSHVTRQRTSQLSSPVSLAVFWVQTNVSLTSLNDSPKSLLSRRGL